MKIATFNINGIKARIGDEVFVVQNFAIGKGGWDDDPEIEIKPSIMDEVVEIIHLPAFNAATANPKRSPGEPSGAVSLWTIVQLSEVRWNT